jgi:hypothetical protein
MLEFFRDTPEGETDPDLKPELPTVRPESRELPPLRHFSLFRQNAPAGEKPVHEVIADTADNAYADYCRACGASRAIAFDKLSFPSETVESDEIKQ